MDPKLVSFYKAKRDIKAMKIMSVFLKPQQRKQIKDLEKQLEHMIAQITAFNSRFSSLSSYAYDSMNFFLIEYANSAFEQRGLKTAEQILIDNYKSHIEKPIQRWLHFHIEMEKNVIVIGKDIPVNGRPEDYCNYPYIIEAVQMLSAWKEKNYGKLSMYMHKMFSSDLSPRKRAGECRKLFEKMLLNTFEIIEIEERGCALSKIVLKVFWTTDNSIKEAVLTLGCYYKGNTEELGLPWRNNGKWVLIPWDVQGLYK